MVCGFAFAFVACGGAKTETEESTEMVEETMEAAPEMEMEMDSVASDTTSMQ